MRRVPTLVLASAAVAALGAGIALGAPGDTTVVSLTSAGAQGNLPADPAAVSADGRFVAFTSAFAYTGVPTGAVAQLFVRDRVAGTTTLASANAAGQVGNGAVETENVGNVLFAISGSGRYVVFGSTASNLSTADSDANLDVFRKDLVTGAVDLISVNSAGQKANAAIFGDPDVSYDGTRVSFGSGAATNLFGADANAADSDVVVRDVAAGTTVLAAQTTAGVQANSTTERSAISADGRAVVFEAPTGTFNLVPGDADLRGNDAIVRNLQTGTTTAASDPTKTTGSGFPDISGDGRFVVFETGEKYDATNDVSAGNDVYRRDMTTAAGFTLVSARTGADTGGDAGGIRPAISADGSRVSFTSASTNLTLGDTNAVTDVYTRDIGTKLTARASSPSTGANQSDTDSARSAIGGAGSLVTFVALDGALATTRLVPTDVNLQPDVLAKELAPTDTTGPATQITSTAAAPGGFAVVVTATDPSGVGSVTANGAALRPGAGTTFSGNAPVAAGGSLKVDARDGSGNASTLVVVPATGPGGGPPFSRTPPKITQLRAKLVKGRIVVSLRLSTAARVNAQLRRRTVRVFKKAPKRRVVLVGVGKAVTKTLAAGNRTISLKPPKLRRKARYVVRVRATTTAGTTTKAVGITVPAAPPPRVRRGG